jgi:glutamate racemase
MHQPSVTSPVGVFDSGVGGLSVLRAIWNELPAEELIYLADQAHVPYGPRPLLEVRSFAEGITHYLLEQGAKLIVVACNAASAAALHYLRGTFPGVPFVGMEPAVKPAAEQTVSKVVGVLATPATFQGELYASLAERFANGVSLLKNTCPGLVAQIESGDLDGPQTHAILEDALGPMLAEGIDTVVLGCTHYPFVIPFIQQIVGHAVRVIDPAPAVARQARRLLEERDLARSSQPGQCPLPGTLRTRFLTTGDPQRFALLLPRLMGMAAEVERVEWKRDQLT